MRRWFSDTKPSSLIDTSAASWPRAVIDFIDFSHPWPVLHLRGMRASSNFLAHAIRVDSSTVLVQYCTTDPQHSTKTAVLPVPWVEYSCLRFQKDSCTSMRTIIMVHVRGTVEVLHSPRYSSLLYMYSTSFTCTGYYSYNSTNLQVPVRYSTLMSTVRKSYS